MGTTLRYDLEARGTFLLYHSEVHVEIFPFIEISSYDQKMRSLRFVDVSHCLSV